MFNKIINTSRRFVKDIYREIVAAVH
jgi:hypothetical protein